MARVIHKIEATKHKNKVYNVAAYARVSTRDIKQMTSLSNQVSFYNDYIQKNPNWSFVKVYIDEGISGTGLKNRDALKEMIRDAKAGKIDIILTKSISRFARNTVDLLKIIRELKNINVEVRFEKENINTTTSDGELMLSILAAYAQNESYNISENIKWGLHKAYENGIYSHRKIYGYTLKGNKYIINNDEAKVVKSIYKDVLNQISCKDIAIKLNTSGIKSPHNKRWSKLTVKFILENIFYTGDVVLQKTYNEDAINHRHIKNTGELPQYIIKQSHEAIIDKNTFKRANALLTKAKSKGIRRTNLYGYNLDDFNLKVHKSTSETIKKIFNLTIQLKSYPEIAEILNKNGIKAPQGKTWESTQIMRIVKNKKYMGEKYGYYPMIIDEGTFYKAQEAIKIRKNQCRYCKKEL